MLCPAAHGRNGPRTDMQMVLLTGSGIEFT